MRSPESANTHSLDGLTDEEIAAQLTRDEGHRVTVPEVRLLIVTALRKLRKALAERGLEPGDFLG